MTTSLPRLAPLLVGALVAVTLGLYGRLHPATGVGLVTDALPVKVWLAGGAAGLALVQLATALSMWGRLRLPLPSVAVHRWSGRAAFLLTVPVAVHCLYALGFATYDLRVLLHSLLGCFFYGAFTAKMLLLPRKNQAWWVLPVAGGSVFTALIGLWLTSALWYLTTAT